MRVSYPASRDGRLALPWTLEGKPRYWDERTAPGLRWHAILDEINRRLATLIEAEAFAFPPPPITGVGTSGGIEAQLQDFAGRSPQDLVAALRGLVFNANQDPALANVFSTCAANVPQLFLEVDRDKAEALVFACLFLVAQYESWSTPVAVILSVVIAVFGALIPLVVLPFLDNNLYARIGTVMLIGLASKNAILIVEFAKVRRDAGRPAAEAAVSAARLRLRLIFRSSLSLP